MFGGSFYPVGGVFRLRAVNWLSAPSLIAQAVGYRLGHPAAVRQCRAFVAAALRLP